MKFTYSPRLPLPAARTGGPCRVFLTKAILVVKLTSILLLMTCLHVHAKVLSQTVTLNERNASLEKVFTVIERQTGYSFVYDKFLLKGTAPVTVQGKDMTLQQALDACLADKPLQYRIKGNNIFLRKRMTGLQAAPPALLPPPAAGDSSINIVVKIVNDKGEPIPGVVVTVKGTNKAGSSDDDGMLTLKDVPPNGTLATSCISCEPKEVKVANRDATNQMLIAVNPAVAKLSAVTVSVSNGYNYIAKERATGSFTQVDNELFNRRVSTNVLDRLDGVTSGVRFQNVPSNSPESPISVRGRSTILSNTAPLIVVDNFPYDGDINNINPNDVENVTILKDAAAASIWGSRSSNGVILITTKKARYKQALRVEVNANVTVGERPDLYASKAWMSSSDFIGVESFLFGNNFFTDDLNNTTSRPPISPVVEILAKRKAGIISVADSAAQINALSKIDARDAYSKYFYQKTVNQQYAINVSGGTEKVTYRFSAGYDDNIASLRRNSYNRLSLNNVTAFTPIKNLEFSVGVFYTQTITKNNNNVASIAGKGANVPYNQIIDANGKHLANSRDYRQSYIDTVKSALNWNYVPLDELDLANNRTNVYDYRIMPTVRYKFFNWLSADVKYQFERQTGVTKNLYSQQTYFARNNINRFYNPSAPNNQQKYPIPLGGILDQTNADVTSNRFRAQVNFDRTFSDKHAVTALAGIETAETITSGSALRLYGYNDDIAATITAMDYVTRFPAFQGVSGSANVPNIASVNKATDEQVSYFTNASYTYNNRYTLSGSARIDQANIFGVDFNNKGVPLWSVGASWKLSDETFYHVSWLPYVRLRATYGYNGNVNKSVGALLTITRAGSFGTVNNPPNPDLRWEKIATTNIGLDFSAVKGIVSGSIEYYRKVGKDLIGAFPVAASSGMTSFTANVANMKGNGIDVNLHTKNIDGKFKWQSDILFSRNTDEVTKYDKVFAVSDIVSGSGGAGGGTINPVVGKPVYAVFSYPWAGLDPATGDPRGSVNKQPSNNYTALLSPTSIDSVIYNGPGRPTFFGAFRNTFSYKGFALSVNITYKMGYYFNGSALNYYNLFNGYAMNSDFGKRWQKPGDELKTNVPSMIYPNNSQRDAFYSGSEANVFKGDHIRLQDVQLSYDFGQLHGKQNWRNNITAYVYINNLGILWRANKEHIDPDFVSGTPAIRTVAVGIKTYF